MYRWRWGKNWWWWRINREYTLRVFQLVVNHTLACDVLALEMVLVLSQDELIILEILFHLEREENVEAYRSSVPAAATVGIVGHNN